MESHKALDEWNKLRDIKSVHLSVIILVEVIFKYVLSIVLFLANLAMVTTIEQVVVQQILKLIKIKLRIHIVLLSLFVAALISFCYLSSDI